MEEDDMIANYSLEPIIEYGMDAVQAKAYKAMIMWLIYSKEVFPNYKFGYGNMPKGDPRKSHIWRCCYKMVRDLDGKLKDGEINLYIRAQLMILKVIEDDNGNHPMINPQILTSKQSWARWCIWKKKYDQKQAAKSIEKIGVESPVDKKLVQELVKTKEFFIHVFKKAPSFSDMKLAYENRSLIRWVKLKKITPLYVVLSPWMNKLLGNNNPEVVFQTDFSGYKFTSGLFAEFSRIFNYEV